MGNKAEDPVDHARTTRKHAGQNMKNTAAFPALIAIGLGVVALFIGLFGFASGRVLLGVVSVAVAVVLAAGGFSWLARERRRVRRVEAEYVAQHPGADLQTPSS
jgi:high-affinity Fe2+/Pb2+ permease